MDDAETATTTTDPVCGMTVNLATAKHRFAHAGRNFAFCCAGCRDKFAADPEHYLRPAEAPPPPPGDANAIYTCPMHPEVRQQGPGSCPLCGMALEPLAPTAEAPPNHELADMSRRFWIALVLAIPVVLLDMGGDLPGLRALAPVSAWIQLGFATPVVLWAGFPFFQRAWASIVHRSLNMFSLIALGTGAAYLDSLAATLVPAWFPAGQGGMANGVPVYFEPASVITVLVLLGQVLELRARDRTGGAIRALLSLAPKTARRLTASGTDEEIPLAHVHPGDRLRMRPGDAVPVDGVVLEGASAVDEAMVTGESMPVEKHSGDRLIGGTVNGTGALVMRAEKVGADTMLARIVALVADAQRSRAPIQRLADVVSGWFVPAVIGVAALAFVAWLVWGPPPVFAHALIAAVSVLIIACPCALGLATPMSISVGIGEGARAGVLIQSAEALERLEQIDTLVIDKTGTLTDGRPTVTYIGVAPRADATRMLTLAASLEQSSEHPIAGAIVAAARDRGLTPLAVSGFTSITGRGVTGTVDGKQVAIGGAAFMRSLDVDFGALAADGRALRGYATVVYLAVDGAAGALIAVSDPIRAGARATLDRLRRDGVRVIMLTGDNAATARAVAASLGIAEARGDLTPEDKHQAVVELRAAGRRVAMAGDGVNDAPAIAAADVGIAMGTGTEVAIRGAAITLVKGDLSGIPRAVALSRATMRNVRQNLVFAFAYNAIGIPVAAGVLYPAFGLTLSPILAALAMSLSSVSVIGNALRLRRTFRAAA